jgi:hypothetical protein
LHVHVPPDQELAHILPDVEELMEVVQGGLQIILGSLAKVELYEYLFDALLNLCI